MCCAVTIRPLAVRDDVFQMESQDDHESTYAMFHQYRTAGNSNDPGSIPS